MKLVFFGSGEFAKPVLERLASLRDAHPLLLVVTRPARPAGRGNRLRETPVAELCPKLGLECVAPETTKAPEFLARMEKLDADLYVVADFGEILRPDLLALPAIGVYNLHGSILPRYRGAAPVAHALLAGEEETGVTLFRIERGLDSGPVVDTARLPIEPEENAAELEARLAHLAADLIERSLPRFAGGDVEETPQRHSDATFAPKLEKRDAEIDWRRSGVEVLRHVRAYNPEPGAFTFLEREGRSRERTVVRRAGKAPIEAVPAEATGSHSGPGAIRATKRRLFVLCGEEAIEILELQRPGKGAVSASAYLQGQRLDGAERFGVSPEREGSS